MSAGLVRRPIVSEGNQTCKPTGFSRGYLTGLRDILYRSGFEVLEKESEEKPDIDFTNLEKDTLISLLA